MSVPARGTWHVAREDNSAAGVLQKPRATSYTPRATFHAQTH